jgi:hypothetical protein
MPSDSSRGEYAVSLIGNDCYRASRQILLGPVAVQMIDVVQACFESAREDIVNGTCHTWRVRNSDVMFRDRKLSSDPRRVSHFARDHIWALTSRVPQTATD